jgi:UDP-N-acetylmuramoylalanine--D-glutamate ligase
MSQMGFSQASQASDAAEPQASQRVLGDVLVLGMGMTGADVARYLVSLPAGRVASVTLYGGLRSSAGETSRELEELGVRVMLGSEDVQGSYDLCVASPGISERSEFFRSAAAHAREIVSEPEFAWRESPERWVAITGTNGKTTTTSLATFLLRQAGMAATAVGNIGNLCTTAVCERRAGEWFVAELSSYQLAASVRLHPHVAVLLNVTPDHLAWHGSLEAYAAAKERIFANLDADDLAVIVCKDAWCRAMYQRLCERGQRCCVVDASGDPQLRSCAFVRKGRLVVRLDGEEHLLCAASDLQILGTHNLENALAAATLALELGAGDEAVSAGLAAFEPLEHRVEPCGRRDGVSFVNDSKATNTDAVEKALQSFAPRTVVLLCGGTDKGTDLHELAELVADSCAIAICYGEAGERLARALEEARDATASPLRIERVPHLAQAFDLACALAQAGQTVLLSPACSSFDEFSNFEERGRVFKRLVATYVAHGEVG